MRWPRSESLFRIGGLGASRGRGSSSRARALSLRAGEAAAEELEPRQLLSTVFGVTDNNLLVEFDSAKPQTVLRATPITGLGDGEVMSAIDFHPGTEKLYGIPSGTRTPVYTIDVKTGVATRVGPGVPFSFPIEKASGLDFDETNGYFRFIDEAYGNYRIDPVIGRTLRNDAGQEGLSEIAYRPLSAPPLPPPPAGLANSGFVGINHMTDQFMRLDPERMTVFSSGSLGVDAGPFIGLDITPDGITYLSLRVGGVSKFGTISSADGHTFVEIGTIGDGTQYAVRNIATEPTRRAPVLDVALLPALGVIAEDDLSNAGTSVRDLIQSVGDGLITDASVIPAPSEGIAITFADAGAGVWQYSLDGAIWTNLGAASESSALLLPADGAARVRLLPNADFNGTVAQALRFRAWDQVAGQAGQRVAIDDAAMQGAFSTATGVAAITVTPVRDAPTFDSPTPSGGAFSINDKQTVALFQLVTIAYIDDATRVLTVDVTIGDATHGAITPESAAANGFTLIDAAAGKYRFNGTAAAATAAIRLLVFKPIENLAKVGQSTPSTFTITADDGLGTGAQAGSPTISVLSSNDTPGATRFTVNNKIKVGQTVKPFRSLVIGDVDPTDRVTVTIRISAPRKGSVTAQTLRASGFKKIASGRYRFTGSAASATTQVRKLKYSWSSTLNTAVTQQVTLTITVADAAGATISNNKTVVRLKR